MAESTLKPKDRKLFGEIAVYVWNCHCVIGSLAPAHHGFTRGGWSRLTLQQTHDLRDHLAEICEYLEQESQ